MSSDKNLRARLDRVKKAIENASLEARRYAQVEMPKPSLLAAPFDDTPVWESFVPHTARDGGNTMDEMKRKSDASLELGMILFGENVPVVEEEISTRLTQVEMDLQDIMASFQALHTADTTNPSLSSSSLPEEYTPERIHRDIIELKHKVEFLKGASEVRLLIDQAEAASLGISKRSSSELAYMNDEMMMFGDSPPTLSTCKPGTQLVETAKILQQAHSFLLNMESRFFSSNKGPTLTTTIIFSQSNHELCFYIYESLAACIRRRRLDLQTKVHSILDTCMGIETQCIRIQDNDGLFVHAWEALFILSQPKVQEYVYTLAKNLGTVILQPLLASCSTKRGGGTGRLNDSSPLLLKHTTWKISERIVPMEDNMFTSHHRGHITGPTCILEWSTTSSPLDLKNNSHAEICKAILHSLDSLLQLLSAIFKFVYEKILCQKNALSTLLGSHLFLGSIHTKDKAPSKSQPHNLDTLLDEIMNHMDASGHSLIQVFSYLKNMIWDFCLPDILDASVLSILPALAESLQKCTTDFETSLVEQGFVKETNMLSEYAIHFEEYVAEKRRALVLSQGRALLVKMDYHNTVNVGTDVSAKKRLHRQDYALALTTDKFDCDDDGMLEFILQKAAISQVAEKLLQMVRETMNCAVDPMYQKTSVLSLRLPATLYRTARELLDLFRIVIPTTYKKEIGFIPRTTALFYNDCVYLAHHCLTLGLEYNDRMVTRSEEFKSAENESSSDLRNHCTFVDLVPLFRELGNRYMVDICKAHQDQLVELVGPRLTHFSAALGSNESVIEWNDAETAQSAGLFHIRTLAQVWKGFLSWDVYSRAMGYFVDAMLGLFLDKIVHAKDISEEACSFTSQVLDIMSRGVLDLFMDEGKPLEEAEKDTSIYCRNWDRVNAVEKFLNMTLVDINVGLSEGVFTSISGPELSALVVSVFQDSEKRRSLLKLLAQDN